MENIKRCFGLTEPLIDPVKLREGVRLAYSSAATDPEGKHPFPVGRWFAEGIGYPQDILDFLPNIVSESFTGVSNVSVFAEIPEGSTVLDLGCGAGLDSLIAAQKAEASGEVIGVDFSTSMLDRARAASIEANQNIKFCCAYAENLPIKSESIDVVLVNGIFNLNPFRHEVFKELARIVKPGGSVYAAELILKKSHRKKAVCKLDDWFS